MRAEEQPGQRGQQIEKKEAERQGMLRLKGSG